MPIDVYAAMGALVRAEAARPSAVPAQSDATAPPVEPPEAAPVATPHDPAPPGAALSSRTAAPGPVRRRTGFLEALRMAWRSVWGICR
ncbi:hypothetical protein ACWC5C_40290 [Streptomyces sp. NPDC001700]